MKLDELLAGPVLGAAPGLLGCLVMAGGVTVRLTEWRHMQVSATIRLPMRTGARHRAIR